MNAVNPLEMLRERMRLKAAYHDVFTSPQGKMVLKHILTEGYMFKSTFVAKDSHETALNEGSRRLALSILRAVNYDSRELEQLMETQKHEKNIVDG